MGRIPLKWTPNIFREIRTMPAVMAELESRAQRVASAAGDGYEASQARATGGRGRGRASVITATPDAMRDEAKNHNLLRAIDAGRG